jgi:hypothetical protein
MAADRYTVSVSIVVKEQLEDALHMAQRVGRRREAIRAARWIIEELERTRLEFGESRDFLTALSLRVRIAFVRPLMVQFAVNEERGVVFILDFEYCERS